MKKKILLIDDEELIVRTLVKALERKGYEVLVAKRGADALVFMEVESFDLILCDIRMPGDNGVETVQKIITYTTSKGQKAPEVIFMSGYADAKVEKEAQALKPVAYFSKPFDFMEFITKVESVLK